MDKRINDRININRNNQHHKAKIRQIQCNTKMNTNYKRVWIELHQNEMK